MQAHRTRGICGQDLKINGLVSVTKGGVERERKERERERRVSYSLFFYFFLNNKKKSVEWIRE